MPAKTGPTFYARLAGNLLSPLPYSVATHASQAWPTLCVSMPQRTSLMSGTANGRRMPRCCAMHLARVWTEARWTVMAHNVESLIWERYAETERTVKRWYIRQQWRKFERFEQWAYSAATCRSRSASMTRN